MTELLLLGPLELALDSLEDILRQTMDEYRRDGAIQRFEYTYELSWKLLQRWVRLNVSPEDAEPRTKKDLFRTAAKKQIIGDPESWFEFAEARNNVAHTYNEKNAKYERELQIQFGS